MKSSKFTEKMEKIKAKWTQVSLENVFYLRSEVIKGFDCSKYNVYAAVHGAIGEERLQETFKKMLTSS